MEGTRGNFTRAWQTSSLMSCRLAGRRLNMRSTAGSESESKNSGESICTPYSVLRRQTSTERRIKTIWEKATQYGHKQIVLQVYQVTYCSTCHIIFRPNFDFSYGDFLFRTEGQVLGKGGSYVLRTFHQANSMPGPH